MGRVTARWRRGACIAAVALGSTALAAPAALAAGSGNLYPAGSPGTRANTEWRTSTYGGAVYRRTLIHVYATAGEHLLMGSTGIGVGAADILVWNPGLVTGAEGLETVPLTPSFSCDAQRTSTGLVAQGRLTTRAEELAGPDTVPAGGVTGGYVPCDDTVPSTGVYSVAMLGPSGFSSDADGQPATDIGLTSPHDYDGTQLTSVAAWDVTVRDDLTDPATTRTGRVFTYLLSLYAGGNGHPVDIVTYPVTPDGYRYRVDDRGMDPAGWVQYGTQLGFLDPDGHTPLYHDAVALNSGHPAQLTSIAAGVKFAKPDYPIFLEPPDPAALTALGIPLAASIPGVSRLSFAGSHAGTTSYFRTGGTFSYNATGPGVYEIVISRDGVDFDPTSPGNRVLRGLRGGGLQHVAWDGRDNSGGFLPVGGGYAFRAAVHGGEYHLPFVDVENDTQGGPTITLLDPPGGVCPPIVGGCSGGFYDDRGYVTSTGAAVGTQGAVLCGLVPPSIAFSDPINGFDTSTTQRAFGTATGGNTNVPCTGSFGDTKGLDTWTYYPSAPAGGSLAIVAAAAATPPSPAPITPSTGAGGTGQIRIGGLCVVAGLLAILLARRPRDDSAVPPIREVEAG